MSSQAPATYNDSPTKAGVAQYFESVSSSSSNPQHGHGGVEMADIANKNTAGAPVGIVCTEEHLGKTIFLETASEPYAEHGPLVDGTRPGEVAVDSHPDLAWPRIRHTMREAFSEVGRDYAKDCSCQIANALGIVLRYLYYYHVW